MTRPPGLDIAEQYPPEYLAAWWTATARRAVRDYYDAYGWEALFTPPAGQDLAGLARLEEACAYTCGTPEQLNAAIRGLTVEAWNIALERNRMHLAEITRARLPPQAGPPAISGPLAILADTTPKGRHR